MDKVYDVVILGGGPAGITAGIYAKRAGLDCIIIEKMVAGGTVATSFEVANFTGFSKIKGIDLAKKMLDHAKALKILFVYDEVMGVNFKSKLKVVKCREKKYKAKTVIIAMGAQVRRLNIVNEDKFIGKGISYCATCDGNFFKGKEVALVGGGNTALENCLYLSNIVKKVYLIHRRDEFRGDNVFVKELKNKKNVEFIFNSVVSSISGKETLRHVNLLNTKTKKTTILDVDGLFVCIGREPNTDMFIDLLSLDDSGYIITDENMCTNIPGVYATGDIRTTPLRQIVTACADGAIAGANAYKYIRSKG